MKAKSKKPITKIVELLIKWNKNVERIEKLQEQQKELDRKMMRIYHTEVLRK